MEQYYLEARHTSRASFYNKAMVKIEGNKKTLISYETEVSYIEDGKAFVLGEWSGTTTRHIKEFLKQNGFKAENGKQILKDYSKEQ